MTAVEIARQGAFYPIDALVVAVLSGALVVTSMVRRHDAHAVAVVVTAVALAAWWCCSAVIHGRPGSFLPLGASILGFLAAFLVVRELDAPTRRAAAIVAASIAAAASCIGLVACAARWYPLAIPSQGLWRLATTITYSDAAGILCAMGLVVALGLDARAVIVRIDIAACLAGLIAAQSRGAVLAVAIAVALVPLAAIRRAAVPLTTGLAAGVVVVATSAGDAAHPGVAVVVACLVAAAAVTPKAIPHVAPRVVTRRVGALIGVACAAVAAVAVVVLRTPIERRVQFASTAQRVAEWRAAFDQWRGSPWIGVGPDALLHVHVDGGTVAHFAHDEYLQVAAGAGIVGVVLLAAAMAAIGASIRRRDQLSACAAAAVVAWAVAGALDFDWHLAALGLIAGWAAGLAGHPSPMRHAHSRRGIAAAVDPEDGDRTVLPSGG